MAQARGYRSQTILDFETEFGKEPTVKKGVMMPFESNNLAGTQNLTEDNLIRNRRDPAKPTPGNVEVAGQIVTAVDPIGFGYWLSALLGAPTSTSGSGGKTTHVFSPKDEQPSLVLEKGMTDIGVYERFTGCKVSQISMTVGGDGALTAAIDIMGAKNEVGNTAYVSDPVIHPVTRFGNFQASLKESDVELGIATTIDFQINANLDGNQYVIGSQGFRKDIPEGLLQISGNVTMLFESKALLEKAIAGTESSLEIKFIDEQANSLTMTFPEVLFGRGSPSIEGPQGVMITLPWRAYYKGGEGAQNTSCMVATLVNSVEGYLGSETSNP